MNYSPYQQGHPKHNPHLEFCEGKLEHSMDFKSKFEFTVPISLQLEKWYHLFHILTSHH